MKKLFFALVIIIGVAGLFCCNASYASSSPVCISGIYPALTMWNRTGGECGVGAVALWQGSLWAITYGPQCPSGSSDKLYEISPDLKQTIFPGSVGGTPANRMIHSESSQLLIGPYLIDAQKNIRVIPPSRMFGRLTGVARHLTDPVHKVYYATMEEGLYEVDVNTLEVRCIIRDGNTGAPEAGIRSDLPGCHGKGLYSGQGRVVYANNGEKSPEALIDPATPSGALAQWFGKGDWQMVRRNQFTEVTGPNGIRGSKHPVTDPVWTMGWDMRSLLLGLLENGEWSYYRLPKGSHSYDGAHGWNTEWPRIREIGEEDLLATMHGTFWRFPRTFSRENSAGILPRSNYLRVIGDFCRWQDRIVLGCDDSARLEFLNTRPFKAKNASPKQSNSNLWFIEPKQLDQFGPVIGRGSVWLRDDVDAETPSDPYLFSGYDCRQLYLVQHGETPINFTLEIDKNGEGAWTKLKTVAVSANGSKPVYFDPAETGVWIRVVADRTAPDVTAHFNYRNRDPRGIENGASFAGIATARNPAATGGLMRSLAYNKLGLIAFGSDGKPASYYEMNQSMKLDPMCDSAAMDEFIRDVQPPEHAYQEDTASIVVIEDGKRFRLPKNTRPDAPFGTPRVCREVATERDLLNIGGTFYELPARNAGGLAKIRPIATHNLSIHDFCSHNGLLLFTGIDAYTKGEHIIRSADGQAAVWAGAVDDLWKLGKPRGVGGPWNGTAVAPGVPSDPYLMTGYDRKSVMLTTSAAASLTLEIDIDGTGLWVPFKTFKLSAGETISYNFPESFSAYWVRAASDAAATVTIEFSYQ